MSVKTAKRSAKYLNTSSLNRPLMMLGAATALLAAGPAYALDANTLPQDPNVVGGSASFSQSGNTLNVNQSTNRAVIDWRSFDIGSNAQTNFAQPNAASIAVNRVNQSANPTQIQGGLHANGQVWILNPNGVVFGKTAHVDAAGIVASTANIDVNAFMGGSNTLHMSGADHGSVVNEGSISVGESGLAAFVAPSVRNSGTITAKVGKVTLAAGTSYTLDLAGDNLVEIGLGAGNALVDQSGKIVNAGGTVQLSAKAASDVVDSIINVSGVIDASSVVKDGGTIVLAGDNINTSSTAKLAADAGTNGNGGTITSIANKTGNYAGSFSAKGGSESGDGGQIETSGHDVKIASGASINASAANGKAGTWTLDPLNVTISTGTDDGTATGPTVHTGTIESSLSSGTSIAITTDQTGTDDGDLTLTGSINAAATGGAGLTLTGRHLSATGGSTIDISGVDSSLILNVNTVNNNPTPSGNWINDALGMVGTVSGGTTINVGDGTYNENVSIGKANITLLSQNGSGVTSIVGQGSSAPGAVYTTSGAADNFTLGSIGHGFTIVGIDNASAGIESAAVYIRGSNSGSSIIGNTITANGDEGLLTDYNAAVTNLKVDSNTFNGKTFSGATAGGLGFSSQFTTANVPRQLVVISGGSGVTNTQNITFTNNQITGIAGGLNSSGQEQGNGLVTIDAVGATITGNNFAGTTTRYADALRARGSNTAISGNTFDGANMGLGTNLLDVKDGTQVGTFADVIANNTFNNGSVYLDHAVGGYNFVFRGVQNAVSAATAGDTVNVGSGTYALGSQLVIDKNLSIVGDASNKPIITAGKDFTGDHVADSMILVDAGITFGLSNAVVDGSGHNVWQALRSQGNTTVDNVDFRNIAGSGSGSPYRGVAIESFGGTVAGGAGSDTNGSGGSNAHLIVTNSTFTNIGREGILIKGDGSTADITGNTYTGKGAGDWLDYGIEVGASGQATITGNTITGNLGVASSDGSTSAGILVTSYYGGASNATIKNNVVTGNTTSVALGYDGSDVSVVHANGNNFSGNTYGVMLTATTATADFTGNWWGTADASTIAASMGGSEASSVNFSSILTSGTDTDGTTAGFQGDFSNLTVTPLGAGSDRINQAVSLVDAGGTINVLAGTYAEALDISKSVDIEGAGVGNTIIQPTTLLATGVTHKYTANVKTAVYVHDTTGVTLNGLTIDANNLGADAVVFWNNASGTISNALIENPMVYSGVQTGQGIAVDATTGNNINLTVSGTTIQNYNKNAIDALNGNGGGAGTGGNVTLNVTGSTFIGRGTGGVGHMAQNGIVLWERGGGTVSATIDNSHFSNLNNEFAATPDDWSVAVLQYGSPNGTVSVSNSDFTNTQSYISTAGGSTNDIDATTGNTFDGVAQSSATNDQLFTIQNKIIDGLMATGNGLVRLVVNNVFLTASNGSVGNAVTAAAGGDTINVQAGNYTLPGQLNINKSLTLAGAGVGSTNITSNSTGYGINVTADNTTLSGFTYNGPTGTGATYGIKVQPDTGVATDRILNFAINNVAINGGYRTGLDINGANGATIDNVSVTGIVHGNGMALTDSANVTITNSTTSNNAWGGLALYQTNNYYDQQVTGISVDGTNTFNDVIPVYSEDESATNDFGTVSLAGFSYVVNSPNNANDVYSWFQKTQQDAINFATDGTLSNGNVNLPTATVQGYTGSGVTGNNIFTVGIGDNSAAMSIGVATNAATSGATVNVLAGNYTLPGQLNINKSLTLSGAGVGSTNIASSSTGYGIYVTANNVTLSSFTYNANPSGSYSFKVSPGGAPSSRVNNFAIDHVTINNSKRTGLDLNGVNGATIDNVDVYNTTSGNGITLTDSANVTITHSMTSGNAWGGLALYQANFNYDQQVNNITVDGTNTFNESNGIYAQDQSATNDFGIVDLSGQGIQYVGQIATGGGDGNYTLFQKTQQGAIDLADAFNTRYSLTAATVQGYDESTKSVAGNNTFYVGEATGGDLLSINAAVVAAISGGTVNVLGGTYAERVTVNKSLTLAGAGMDSTYLTDGIQIPNSPAITGLTFKDFTVSGDGGTGAVVKQGRVTDFTMEGVRIDGSNVAGRHGFASGKFDGAISITNSEFVNIRGWSAFDTSTGGALGHLTSVVFSGNLLDNSAGHIVFRQSTPTVGVTISNNIVRNVGDTTDLSSGIFKVFGATTVDFSGNNISDISANGAGHPATTSGILDGAALIVNGVDTLNVTNNTFTNNQEAILIGDGNALPTTTNFTGNTFTNNAYDIQLAGGTGAGTLIFGAGNNFVSGAQTQQHLLWGGSGNIDMTQVQFDGKIGSAMTNDELFAAEDLITDGLDNGTSGFASLKAGNVYVTQASGSIQNGVNAASSGNTVNVQAGNYALPSTLHIGTSLTLTGAGEGSTTIDGSGVASGYAIDVAANNVSLGGFTLNGSSDLGGIDVQTTAAAGAGATGFQIANVTINNQSGYGMSVVGGSGATIDNLTVDGSTGGDVGVAINDSANVTITNTKTSGNEIGLGVYQTGDTSSQQLTGLSVDTTNNFSEDAPVYILDAGTGGQELGALSILGFGYAIGNTTDLGNAAVLQTTQQNAINNSVALTTPSDSFVVGWTGSAVTTTYTVGTSTGGTAMSIAAALGHSASGNTINVLTGTYGEAVNVTGLRTLNFGTVTLNSLTLGAGAAGSSLTGTIAAGSVALNGAVTLSGATTLNTSAANGNVTTSAIDGNQALTINAGTGAVSLGNLGATTRLGAVSVTGPATLTGTTYAANSLSLGSATLSGDTTLDTTGALTTGAVDGAHALTVKAASASLGNLGATTRLGAVSVTGPATLTGTTYAANSQAYGGSVTLTGNTTMSSVNGGGITIAGNLFGTTNGGQNLTLNAGTGTGALSANGDISLQNVGTSGTRLNNMTVSGNNFSAATVYLAGNYSATLLGNQVFTSQTLNAGGAVNSNVGGNAIGPINAGGAVNMNVGGNLSGNINGTAITLNTGSITGSTITGTTSITANSNTISTSVFNAPTIDAHASSVQGTLNGDTIALDATQFANVVITGKTVNVHTPAGVVTGTWDTIGTDGSGILAINGETTLGVSGIGPNQLVVEGFALPAGTTVTPSGALVLPTGVLVGLLSPAGASGQPKVVLVHSVQRLGELLANGYTAIVIDLNNKKKEDKEIVVASN